MELDYPPPVPVPPPVPPQLEALDHLDDSTQEQGEPQQHLPLDNTVYDALSLPPPASPTPPPPPPPPLHELPTVLNDLVPLSYIVERVVQDAHSALANLAETLPSSQDAARKRAIVDYVLQTRRQILKLLVLVRWSGEAGNVAKCMNIIGFLSRQNYEFEHSVSTLTSVKEMLAGARVRNYDIPTALSVLTSGTYTRLPSIIKEGFDPLATEKLSDEVVLKTLEELDEVLRWRLACVEKVPRGMSKYWIADGRATFRVEGMWEASFTYGGGDTDQGEEGEQTGPAAEWYLLSFKFLFRVKDARGVWSNTPTGPMKDHIIELANRELARRRGPPEAVATEGQAEASTSAEILPPPTEPKPDTPLVRGYAFLQRLALSYQLEAIYTQAIQLANTIWNGHLKVELNQERTTLKVEYWTPPKNDAAQPLAITAPSPPSNSLTFSVLPPSSTSSHRTSLETRLAALDRALQLGSSADAGEEADGGEPTSEALSIVWTAEGLTDVQKSGVDLRLDENLDLAALLSWTSRLHAKEATLSLYEQLKDELENGNDAGAELELVWGEGADAESPTSTLDVLPSIRVHLHAQHSLLASIHPLSGRLEFVAQGEVSSVREQRLRNAADKVDLRIGGAKSVAETLGRVRASTILDEVDSRAQYLGLTTTRRLPLRSADLTKFGTSTRSLLFIHLLGPSTNHYLVLVMTERGFRFALIGTREGHDQMQSWVAIEEVGWLEKGVVVSGREWGEDGKEGDRTFGFDVSMEDLQDLHSYCVRRIAFFKIEQQLHARRIPYQTISSTTSTSLATSSTSLTTPPPSPGGVAAPSSSSSTPYLVIQSSDLLRSTARVAYPNIAIQCALARGNVLKTTFSVRFRQLSLARPDPAQLPPRMTYNPKSEVVTFSQEDGVEESVERFLAAYSVVARSIVLAQHRRSLEAKVAPLPELLPTVMDDVTMQGGGLGL